MQITPILFATLGFVGHLISGEIQHPLWKFTLETGQMGPVETLVSIEKTAAGYLAHNRSGALDVIRALPNVEPYQANLAPGLFAFEFKAEGDGYQGRIVSPWKDGTISFNAEGDQITGSIDGGMFAGSFSGIPASSSVPLRDYPALVGQFDRVVGEKIFDPQDLMREEYLVFRESLGAVAGVARDDLDLLLGFKFAWTQKPFSHFQMRRFPAPAGQVIASFDGMRVGYEAARVEFDGDIAVLRVDTMMGSDTIEQIDAAYNQIAARRSRTLIIDLRGNGGGAFAVKPLVEHVISEPLDAGYFVSQKWNQQHRREPTAQELNAVEIWNGWSIIGFWQAVQNQPLIRVRFHPEQPHFAGPVYVLIDAQSASATEMAVDALRASGRVTIIGEKTAGEMLSQSFFDVGEGFVVSLPVADYYSVKHGRIEGVGVPVDIDVDSEAALEKAKVLAKESL